jgi:hypothetical protein
MDELLDVEKLKRRLRKKLRQIENLEVAERELNDEEVDKVRRKGEIRAQLGRLVRNTELDEEEVMKRQHEDTERAKSGEASAEKKACIETEEERDEPVMRFSETEVVAELHYREEAEPVEALDPEAEPLESPSSEAEPAECTAADTAEGWQLVTRAEPGGEAAGAGREDRDQPTPPDPARRQQPRPSTSQAIGSQPSTSQSKPPGKALKPAKDPVVEAVRSSGWTACPLEGHEDLVLDVDLDLELGLAVTASRDTTVKVRARRQDCATSSGTCG